MFIYVADKFFLLQAGTRARTPSLQVGMQRSVENSQDQMVSNISNLLIGEKSVEREHSTNREKRNEEMK